MLLLGGRPAWVYDDGGAIAAGFSKSAGDCVCRSAAIASRRSYAEVRDLIHHHAKNERPRKAGRRSTARGGVYKRTIDRVMKELGGAWTATMGIGTGCRVHLRADELPPGRLVVSLSKHVSAVVDGVVYDTFDPTRGGTRCVYGYWEFNDGQPV